MHVAKFGSLEGIALAKAEIFSHPRTQIGFINAQVCGLEQICATGSCAKQLFSSSSSQVDSARVDYRVEAKEGFLWIYEKEKLLSRSPWHLPGIHNAQNFLGAALLAHSAGLSWEQIEKTSSLKLPAQRFEQIERRGITLINDSYNAGAKSVCAALDHLPSPKPGGRKIGVLTDLLELGSFEEQENMTVATHSLKHLDLLFCLGGKTLYYERVWRKASRPLYCYRDREELLRDLQAEAKEGDVILFKGGRLYALEELVAAF
jgi:UDP-N-acetylmuramoyl-tripeptide--D-alanyl-D-alanine ligase